MERIDVHAHCVPPAYREYCLQNEFAGKGHPDGMPAIPVGPNSPNQVDRVFLILIDRIGVQNRTLK